MLRFDSINNETNSKVDNRIVFEILLDLVPHNHPYDRLLEIIEKFSRLIVTVIATIIFFLMKLSLT